jgi:4-diphosphocytidyl-2-C-methyl-D-erythritol kinase
MIAFPNCKINLGLHVFEQRPDKYHPLETVFFPVPICDALEIIKHPNPHQVPEFNCYGLEISGDPQNNLIYKAWELLHAQYKIGPVKSALLKHIPMGAGMGGGSADAAFALKLLNQLFELHLTENTLLELALILGSDCPFFILNKPVFASSRGEIMQPINLNLQGYTLVIVNPAIHVSTAKAFQLVKKRTAEDIGKLLPIVYSPIEYWKTHLVNDFEEAVFSEHPSLKNIKSKLYEMGAVYASMTGSGSTIFGIFANPVQAKSSFNNNYFVEEISL